MGNPFKATFVLDQDGKPYTIPSTLTLRPEVGDVVEIMNGKLYTVESTRHRIYNVHGFKPDTHTGHGTELVIQLVPYGGGQPSISSI